MILRAWQAAALPLCIDAAVGRRRSVVSAVMGSGKSVLIAEICAHLAERMADGWQIIVTTPTVRLVDQLHATISDRVECGRYYTHAKDTTQRVIVACCPSAPALARHVRCALWIPDEAHRTTSDTMQAAYDTLHPDAVLGFSATPYSSSESKRLHMFDDLVFEYGAQQAMQDGVIVPPVLRHYEGTKRKLDTVCLDMVQTVEGPGLINARDIIDAEEHATWLCSQGYPAAAIHSQMSRQEQADAIEALRTGSLRALVHVKLLTEGVDLPWLRWLCLRHPITSRVTFCQMVGRVLRSAEGKRSAVILDPHDLFNEFSLTYDAMLGGAPEPSAEEQARATVLELQQIHRDQIEIPIVMLGKMSSYLRRLAIGFYAAGLAERKIKSRQWRRNLPTKKQVDVLEWASLYCQSVPTPHRELLRECVDAVREGYFLDCGDVADLITVLFAVREHGWQNVLEEDQ